MPISRRSFCASLLLGPSGTLTLSMGSVEAAEFNYRQFLKDASGGETAFRHYTTLTTNKKAFMEAYGFTDREYKPMTRRTIQAKSVPAALVKDEQAFIFGWSGDLEEFFEELGSLLKKRGSSIDIKALENKAMAYLNTFNPGRGEHIGHVYGPVAEALETEALLLANINDTGSSYHFFLLPRSVMGKWLGKQLDNAMEIEHPGAYFSKQLKGTPYAKYFNEAPRLGKKSDPVTR